MRVLSNFIDNAIDATRLVANPKITVEAIKKTKKIEIIISDNGQGMPQWLINKLGNEEISYKKINGNGTGIYRAFVWARQNNSKITITSQESLGTVVRINIFS